MATGIKISGGCLKISGGCLVLGTCGSGGGDVRARNCGDNSLANVRMSAADAATLPGAFTLMHGIEGYYFAGDAGTTETLYSAADAQAYANCAAIACGSGSCGSDGDFPLDTSGPWDLSAAGFTDYAAGTLLSQPRTLTDNGSCNYVDLGPGLAPGGSGASLPGLAGAKYLVTGFGIGFRNADGEGNTICDHYVLQVTFFDLAGSVGNQVIYFLGPLVNGAGSKTGRYYYWYDSTTTIFDSNSFGTNGVMMGHCPAYFDMP